MFLFLAANILSTYRTTFSKLCTGSRMAPSFFLFFVPEKQVHFTSFLFWFAMWQLSCSVITPYSWFSEFLLASFHFSVIKEHCLISFFFLLETSGFELKCKKNISSDVSLVSDGYNYAKMFWAFIFPLMLWIQDFCRFY